MGGPPLGCTATGTAPWPAACPGPAARAAATPLAWRPRPSACRWRGRNTSCRPWRPLRRRRRKETGAARAWAAACRGRGTRWWSSCASSTWPVGSGTRPARIRSRRRRRKGEDRTHEREKKAGLDRRRSALSSGEAARARAPPPSPPAPREGPNGRGNPEDTEEGYPVEISGRKRAFSYFL